MLFPSQREVSFLFTLLACCQLVAHPMGRSTFQVIYQDRTDKPEALISSYIEPAAFMRLPERETKEQNIIIHI